MIFPSTAQAYINFPPFCRMGESSIKFPEMEEPVSSLNSLRAVSNFLSPSFTSPFGIVHAPKSLDF